MLPSPMNMTETRSTLQPFPAAALLMPDFNYTVNLTGSITNSSDSSTNNPATVISAVAVLALASLGFLGNALLFLVTVTFRPIRSLASWPLLAHCMLVDCLMAATRPTMAVPLYLYMDNMLPDGFCRFQPLFSYVLYVASMYASTVLAVYRLVARMVPHRFGSLTTRSVLWIALSSPWLAAVLLNIFPLAQIGMTMERSSATGLCVMLSASSSDGDRVSLIAYSVFATYLPTALKGLCYTAVFVQSVQDVRRQRAKPMILRRHAVLRRLEISKTLVLSYGWQCCSLYPLVIVASCYPVAFGQSKLLQLRLRILSNSYTTFNPLFYWASSKLYSEGTQAVAETLYRFRWRATLYRPNTVDIALN